MDIENKKCFFNYVWTEIVVKRIFVLLITFSLCVSLIGFTSCSSGTDSSSVDKGPITVQSDTPKSANTDTEYKFKFELSEDGEAYQVVDNGVYNGNTIIIPSTYNDKPVTVIAERAFCKCKKLESITFSENISFIDSTAFCECSELKEIKIVGDNTEYRVEGNCLIENSDNKIVLGCSTSVIPSSVTAIGEHAFYKCAALKIIDIPASVTDISEKAYYKCTALKTIRVDSGNTVYTSENSNGNQCNCLIEKATHKVLLTCLRSDIPEDASMYGDYAFTSNTSIVSLTVPDGMTEISNDMLKGCTDLITIEIPASITSISGHKFEDCRKLKTIIIKDEDRSAYKVDGGCVIKKDTGTLTVGTVGAVIPDYVSSIEEYAFFGREITDINIPSSVKCIQACAFGRTALKSATFAVADGWYVASNIPFADQGELSNEKRAAEILKNTAATIYRD